MDLIDLFLCIFVLGVDLVNFVFVYLGNYPLDELK